jgi:hypothetical protein
MNTFRIGVRCWAFALAAMGLAACAPPVVDPAPAAGEYTLTFPADVFLSRPMLAHRATVKSGELCKQGYTVLSQADTPSAVVWKIRCNTPSAVVR